MNKTADNLVLAGDVEEEGFRQFEELVFENYEQNNNTGVYAHNRYLKRIEDSEVIHDDAVNFFDSDYSSNIAIDILAQSKRSDRSIFLSDEEYKEDLRRWIDSGKEKLIVIYE